MEANLELIDIFLKGGVSGMGAFLLYRINSIEKTMRKMADSVNVLNTNVARYMERLDSVEKRLTRLEDKN